MSPGTFQAREPDRAVETQDTGHSEPMPDVAGGRQFWKGEEAGGILQQPGLQRPPPGFPHLLQKAATPQTGQLSPRIAGERGPDQCGRWGALCSLPPPFPLLRALSATFPQMSPRVWPWELLPRSSRIWNGSKNVGQVASSSGHRIREGTDLTAGRAAGRGRTRRGWGLDGVALPHTPRILTQSPQPRRPQFLLCGTGTKGMLNAGFAGLATLTLHLAG